MSESKPTSRTERAHVNDDVEVTIRLTPTQVKQLRHSSTYGMHANDAIARAVCRALPPEPHVWKVGDWFNNGYKNRIVDIHGGNVSFVWRHGGETHACDVLLEGLNHLQPCDPADWWVQEHGEGSR